MDKELFFKQVKEFDKMAAKLTLAAARNNFFVLNSNNSSIGVRWLNEKILFDAIEKAGKGLDKPTFVDPCCGYGVSLVFGAKLGYEVYGSDIENMMVKVADKMTSNLEKYGIIPEGNIKKITVGDMLDLKNYISLGVGFSEVDIFYDYTFRGMQEKFFHLFSDSAKKGAKLVHVPGYKKMKRDSLLDLMGNIELNYEHPDNIYQIYTKK